MTDPADRKQRAHLTTVYRGAEQGFYSLPASLHEALNAEAYIGEQLSVARAARDKVGDVSATTAALAGDIVEAARQGKSIADFDSVIADAEETARRANLAVTVLELAAEQAAYQVIYGTEANAVIAGHLRPALEEVLDIVRKAAPKLADTDVTAPESYLRSAEPVRKAYTALQDAATRYGALRTAQRAAGALVGGPQQDKAGWFTELRDPAAHGVGLGGPADRPQPWPDHPAARLLWLAALPEGSVWMPTVAEQDAAAQQYLAEQQLKHRGRGIAVAAGW